METNYETTKETCTSIIRKKGKSCIVCGHFIKCLSHVAAHMRTHTNERPFKCSICNSSHRMKAHRDIHVRFVHGPEKRPKCKKKQCVFCLKLIASFEMFRHLRSHIKEKALSCSICEKEFFRGEDLNNHIKSHSKVQGAPCIFCEKTFSFRASPDDHLRSHIKEKPFFCNKCPSSFSQLGNLSAHIRSVHLKERSFVCNVCGKSFVRLNKEAHIRSHLGEIPFKCKVCGKRLKTDAGLRSHLKAHKESNLNSFPCPKCSNSYAHVSNLRRHENEVHQETKCTLCKKVVPRNVFMNHIKGHWKEKSYSCTMKTCAQGLLNKDRYTLHLQSQHSNIQNVSIVCVFCKTVFPTRQLLEKHVRSYTSTKPFSCKKCPKSFAFSIDLRAHGRLVHPQEKTLFCVICGKRFSTTYYLQLHISSHLNEEPSQCNATEA